MKVGGQTNVQENNDSGHGHLVAYASNAGVFLLGIEYTDQKREKTGARNLIIDSLHRIGIDYNITMET